MARTTTIGLFVRPSVHDVTIPSVWNRRLLIAVVTLILLGLNIFALHQAGPEARALAAGEGAMISQTR